jgi:hypothetical protein
MALRTKQVACGAATRLATSKTDPHRPANRRPSTAGARGAAVFTATPTRVLQGIILAEDRSSLKTYRALHDACWIDKTRLIPSLAYNGIRQACSE